MCLYAHHAHEISSVLSVSYTFHVCVETAAGAGRAAFKMRLKSRVSATTVLHHRSHSRHLASMNPTQYQRHIHCEQDLVSIPTISDDCQLRL